MVKFTYLLYLILNVGKGIKPSIVIGKKSTKIVAKGKLDLTRYLGVWFNGTENPRPEIRALTSETSTFCSILRHKQLVAKQIVYLNNRVLILRLEYRLCTTFLKPAVLQKIHKPMYSLLKHKTELALTTPNNVCTHPGQLDLKSLEQNHKKNHYTEFIVRINDP